MQAGGFLAACLFRILILTIKTVLNYGKFKERKEVDSLVTQ